MHWILLAWAGFFGLLAADAFRKQISYKAAEQMHRFDSIDATRADQSANQRLNATEYDRIAVARIIRWIPFFFAAISTAFFVSAFIWP